MRKWLLLTMTAIFALAALAQGPYHMVASSKQIMAGVQKPSMDTLAAMMKAGGPKDDKEWEVAAQSAAVLAETAQLLLMGERPKDQTVWIKNSNGLHDAAMVSMKAAQEKNVDAWKASLGTMGAACKGCHTVHRKRPGQQQQEQKQ